MRRVHILTTALASWRESDVARAFDTMLAPEERRRADRSVNSGREKFVVGRALLRWALSSTVDVEPSAWRFTVSASGKPKLSDGCGLAAPAFNLAHTDGLVVCAIMPHGLIGVDVEAIAGDRDFLGIASHFFSPHERAVLAQVPISERRRCFLEQWTLKEAFVKATGSGLSRGLDRFWFERDAAGDIRAVFEAATDRDCGWCFEQRTIQGGFVVAVAASEPVPTHWNFESVGALKVVPRVS